MRRELAHIPTIQEPYKQLLAQSAGLDQSAVVSRGYIGKSSIRQTRFVNETAVASVG